MSLGVFGISVINEIKDPKPSAGCLRFDSAAMIFNP